MTTADTPPRATNRYGRTVGPYRANRSPSTAFPPMANPPQTRTIIASTRATTRPSPGLTRRSRPIPRIRARPLAALVPRRRIRPPFDREDVHGLREPLEGHRPPIAQASGVEPGRCRRLGGHQDLVPVGQRGHAGGPVHLDPAVVAAPAGRLRRVDPDAHPRRES